MQPNTLIIPRLPSIRLPLQIGGTEWLWIILAVVILLFGSKKLPELARGLGRAQAEFHRGRAEIEREMQAVLRSSPPAAAPEHQIEEAAGPELLQLRRAAQALAIDTEGKTVEQLRSAIRAQLQLSSEA